MQIKTIGELRAYRDEREAEWTESDNKYLGTFESQELKIPYFSPEGKFCGYGVPHIDYSIHTWFIVDVPRNDWIGDLSIVVTEECNSDGVTGSWLRDIEEITLEDEGSIHVKISVRE